MSQTSQQPRSRRRWLPAFLGPGLLVAATGVGAGDLATAGFAGSKFGYAVLWAIPVGALVKLVLTEGLARWQIATGRTLIEGVGERLGRWLLWVFLLYVLYWCFFVGAALITATGVATHALLPMPTDFGVFDSPAQAGQVVYGVGLSMVGLLVAWLGGFRVFERVMGVCIAVMFVTTLTAAVLARPDWSGVVRGLVIPTIPEGGLVWTVALMGGVGGTVTILSYGYWLRESGRDTAEHYATCRIDLTVAYAATALFGVAVAVLATGVETSGRGLTLIQSLGDHLKERLGAGPRLIFLLGVWAAMFSSLLGVWQSAPSMIADTLDRLVPAKGGPDRPQRRRWRYRVPLLLLSTVPIAQVFGSFKQAQLLYAVTGAAFIPMVALVLLLLTTRRQWIGDRWVTRGAGRLLLAIALIASIAFASNQLWRLFS
ncbi:MAG: Nramp family divalent metal transporter [Planctomycetota bacterium]